jgi:tripartite-type tricarboxylate transporter receptor subunit TctC
MLVSLAVVIAPEAFAQAFPAKMVRFVIPFPVGGSSDANARIIIPPLSERWKQQIIVEPRPGAGTVVGTDYVSKSAPDGHTLLLTSNLYGYAPAVYAKLPYDPYNDLSPITIVTVSPQAIVVHPSLPARNTRELIALARARPGQLNMGTAGSVLPVHFFNMLAKTNIEVVPYKGAGPLMIDAMGGHIPLALAAISSVQGAVRSGRVKILAVCSKTPSVLFPDAPLIGKDLPGYDVNAWFGLMAPKGVSPEYVRRVRDDVAAVIQMPEVRQRLIDIGGEPSGITPEEFTARVRSEIAMWKKVAAEVGLKPE